MDIGVVFASGFRHAASMYITNKIDCQQGLFSECQAMVDADNLLAEFLPSPNFGDRPAGSSIDLVVLHNISLPPGEFGGPWITDLFLNRLDKNAHPYFAEIADNPVSAHALVRRNGAVTQYVPFHQRAWHAGRSQYCGRENCNDYSIGIELEGDDSTPFTVSQYRSLTTLLRLLLQAYPDLSTDRITGHSDIAPGRKTDPGPYFNWQRLRNSLAAALG